MKKDKKIKGSHIVIVGAGPSTKKYWDKIEKFIKDNNAITFGCNNISNIFIPDYHIWGSPQRWREFGHLVNENSKFVFRGNFDKKIIRERWGGPYIMMNNVERRWEPGFEDEKSEQFKRCCVRYKNKKMYGCFKHVGVTCTFWAYVQGASRISIVGNDGYTLYAKDSLKDKTCSQHCYGSGFTDGFTYEYCLKRDMDRYRTLRLLYKYCKKKYGFGFEFITPTIFNDFYNPDVLDIKEKYEWEEPSLKDYKYIMKNYMKNRKLDKYNL